MPDPERFWPVCRYDDLRAGHGAAALVHGHAVAIFRTEDGTVHALANHDPFGRSSALARGVVGSRGPVPVVSSPVHGHAFDLRTGLCLDEEGVRVACYEVLVTDGTVHVGPRRVVTA
ncbi:nitrite reductase small subunit NirD [Nocardioides coralli]|nr:nitrite reductase small subunit NirD [Nocardioides coralli]QZY30936.1 nitrite reductase small subunit NirD [Nocardioides coralli]